MYVVPSCLIYSGFNHLVNEIHPRAASLEIHFSRTS